MSKIALITDTHYGIRSDNIAFHDYTKKFLDNIFFPYIDENEIKTIIHLGDVTDRRKFINYHTANRLDSDFIQPILSRNIDFHVIIGNHDVYWKNTNEINSMRQLYDGKFNIIETPTEITIDNLNIVMMPWICAATEQDSFDLIKNTTAQVLMGHLEIQGFEMYRGVLNEHGLSTNIFDKFDLVFSGHFHHKSSYGNINYLGSHGEFTWSDCDDERGFHIFDTESRELTFIKNPYKMFNKITYDDTDKDITYIDDYDFNQYTDSYIKVLVKHKNDNFIFDRFITSLESCNPLSLQVIENTEDIIDTDTGVILNEAEDTITILSNYINQSNTKVNKSVLNRFIQSLYKEAINLE